MITVGLRLDETWYPIGVYGDSGAAHTLLHADIAHGAGFAYRAGPLIYLQVGDGTAWPLHGCRWPRRRGAPGAELSQNGGAGLLVVTDGFGSEARIDSRQIVFSGNAGGATVGNVIDVAVGP